MLPHTIPKPDAAVNPMPATVDLHASPAVFPAFRRLDDDGRWLDGLKTLLEAFDYELTGLSRTRVADAYNALGYFLRHREPRPDPTNERTRARLIKNALAETDDLDRDEETR